MPNPWLNEHKSTAAMNYFLNKHMGNIHDVTRDVGET